MFTGLVRECGRLTSEPEDSTTGGVLLRVGHSRDLASRLGLGASLSVSGVCLTVIEQTDPEAPEGVAAAGIEAITAVELSPETLRRTTLGALECGSTVNLEPALAAGEPLGGHWVQGHVDATLEVREVRQLGDHAELSIELPSQFAAYVVEKGSVTLDGVSLTVSALHSQSFEVALIPHTLLVTNLDLLTVGSRVNFEVDVLAKYVHRALETTGRLDSGMSRGVS
ncbi:MAG: riboflavin synthase [Thermoanaerobaculia bacterium]|nr:riboflavin synthase [Thermoanaerobaculia bacterium]